MKAKEWTVYHSPGTGRSRGRGFDTRRDVVKFIAQTIKDVRSVKDIKWKGKNISAKTTLELLSEAQIIYGQVSD